MSTRSSFVERAAIIKGATTSNMLPGEKLFYERCTLCHVPREPGDYTRASGTASRRACSARRSRRRPAKLVLEFLEKNAKDAILP